MRAVHGVATLEHDDVDVGRQLGADLRRRLAGEHALGQLKAPQLAAQVVLAALPGHHLHACGCRVGVQRFELRISITSERGLQRHALRIGLG